MVPLALESRDQNMPVNMVYIPSKESIHSQIPYISFLGKLQLYLMTFIDVIRSCTPMPKVFFCILFPTLHPAFRGCISLAKPDHEHCPPSIFALMGLATKRHHRFHY